jgi:hypothetical protein
LTSLVRADDLADSVGFVVAEPPEQLAERSYLTA